MVTRTKERSRWPTRHILRHLEVSPATYYRWPKAPITAAATQASPPSVYEILPAERQAILDYARKHPEVRHRELAWKMVDDDAAAVSASTVYRVLGEANLVCRWQPKARSSKGRGDKPTRPDECWQTDIRFVRVGAKNYYLLSFLDVYARYVVHHELLRFMDARPAVAGRGCSAARHPTGHDVVPGAHAGA